MTHFLDARGDQSMRVRIFETDPTTLDEALKLACRLEAIARAPTEDSHDDHGRPIDRFAVAAGNVESDRRIEILYSALGDIRDELSRKSNDNGRLQRELRRQRDHPPPGDPSENDLPSRRKETAHRPRHDQPVPVV